MKRYYYQTNQGEVVWVDQNHVEDPECQGLIDNVRAMQQGLIKMFRCPFTENKVVRCFGVV